MKRMKKSLCALLFSCALLAGSVPAAAETAAAAQDTVQANVGVSEDRKVSVTVSVKENTNLTSGRVFVYYDPSVLTLEGASVGGTWDVEDVNTDITSDSRKAVSVAWASAEENKAGGQTAVLTFQPKESAEELVAEIELVPNELYADEAKVTLPGTEKVQVVVPSSSGSSGGGDDNNSNDNNSNNNSNNNSSNKNAATTTITPNAVSTSTVGSAKTGDNANFANMFCLIGLGCVVLAYAARKQMSAAHVTFRRK